MSPHENTKNKRKARNVQTYLESARLHIGPECDEHGHGGRSGGDQVLPCGRRTNTKRPRRAAVQETGGRTVARQSEGRGLPQLFTVRRRQGDGSLAVGRCTDDRAVAGQVRAIHQDGAVV
ncbi:hypothetical protein D3C78_1290340 [compost metagenome]